MSSQVGVGAVQITIKHPAYQGRGQGDPLAGTVFFAGVHAFGASTCRNDDAERGIGDPACAL